MRSGPVVRRPRSAHLRPWAVADAAVLLAASADPELARQLAGSPFDDETAAAAFVSTRYRHDDHARNWAVVDGDDAVVGNVGVTAIEPVHGTAWISYWLTPAARGAGLATRALVAASADAFALGLHRLELGHRSNNPASCGVATRSGFVVEGTERDKLRYGDERFDVETHARLATDPAPDVEPLPVSVRDLAGRSAAS